MGIVVDGFERVAEALAERTSQSLSTNTVVLDERGVVVASDQAGLIGARFDTLPASQTSYLRVPLRLDDRNAEIVIAEPRNGEVISPGLARVMVDLIVNQTAVVERLPNTSALKGKLIHDLLLGNWRDEASVLREAAVLGMDFSAPRAVILIDAKEFILRSDPDEPTEDVVARRAQLVIAGVVRFFDLPNDTICAYFGEGEVVVLKASSTRDLFAWTEAEEGEQHWVASWANLTALKRASAGLLERLRCDTRSTINVGIGRYHPGIRGLASSYRDARAALRLGRRFHGQNRVHCLDGLGIAAFIGVPDESTKIDLATHLLSPLDHEPELLATLDTFFANDCSASLTAAKLSIHRNTLAYRLDKITSLTGLDPRRFEEAVQAKVALTLRSLKEAD